MTDLPETPPADWDDGDLPESDTDEDQPEVDYADTEPPT